VKVAADTIAMLRDQADHPNADGWAEIDPAVVREIADALEEKLSAVAAKTIADEQMISVVDECGYPPDSASVTCPTCGASPGERCETSRGTVRKPHAARYRAADVAVVAHAERCAAVWNTRHAGATT
jgi:microcompartment protein CcmK/EutM